MIVRNLVLTPAFVLLLSAFTHAAAPPHVPDRPSLAIKAEAVLRKHCYRCHGQDGAVEGGFNFILEHEKLVSRRKIVPGKPDESSLYRRITSGKMPPASESIRPDKAELAILRDWIEAGAPGVRPSTERVLVQESTSSSGSLRTSIRSTVALGDSRATSASPLWRMAAQGQMS